MRAAHAGGPLPTRSRGSGWTLAWHSSGHVVVEEMEHEAGI